MPDKFYIFLLLVLLQACNTADTPKPYGYFRIDLPEHSYITNADNKPFQFEYHSKAQLINRTQSNELYWFDVKYPQFNASVHVSYKSITGNLRELSEETRSLVYKHSIKADNIIETAFQNNDRKVFGILYDLKGNTASNLQFVITDSNKHFIRGALYFDNVPNKDSIAPVAEYIRMDMIRFMESFSWKK
jgi:gliding motility-associated lipoprotein GldD